MNPFSLRALVVEDELPARNYLVELLHATGSVEVAAAVETLDEARQLLGEGDIGVDIAFVDINLATSGGRDSGLTLVREMAGKPGAPLFVLTTALKQHAIEAFELGVVDYILKPFDEERIRQCLDRLRARLPKPAPRPRLERIVARRNKGIVFLLLNEVWAFEASGRLTFVHTTHGRFDIDLSLAALETSYGERLMRVHRNWLVNIEHVKAMEREDGDTEVFVGTSPEGQGVRVPVARERAKAVKDLLLSGAMGIRKPQ